MTLATEPTDSLATFILDPGSVRSAVAAASGGDFVVAWMFPRTADPESGKAIRVLRYRPGEGPGDLVTVADHAQGQVLVGAAFARDHFLVVWTRDGGVHAVRIGLDGTVSAPFEVDPGPVLPEAAMTTDGESVLVLVARPSTTGRAAIQGMFVD